MITYVHGNDIGEYFGSSLATGDLNKDGLHDLIVGAPHWGNDKGRVHVYLGSSKVINKLPLLNCCANLSLS